jgi:excisionase family DNA binding protein
MSGGEKLLSLAEAATMLRLSRSQLYELHETGKIPARQINGRDRILFRVSELRRWLTKPKKRMKNDNRRNGNR